MSVIRSAGSRAMIGVRANARAKMHTYVHYLLIVCTSCMLDLNPTIFSIVTLCVMVHVNQSTGLCQVIASKIVD